MGIDDEHRGPPHRLTRPLAVIINDASDRTLDFAISAAPLAADNERLLRDFAVQAQSLPEHPDPQQRTYKSNFEIEAALPPKSKPETHNGYLNVWRTDKSSNMTPEELAQVLTKVNNKARDSGFSTTIVMMPRSASSKSKRAANPWGTYDLPAMEARRQNPEAVLSSQAVPATSKAPSLEDFPVVTEANGNKNAKGPVRGILPACFSSMSACQSQTHNCSSHGECTLLHKGRGSGSNQETIDCYGCACKPTVEHVGEDKGMESKRKVTYWGGPACQKKDISVQFWLFVGSGVILAFLVSAGIGMLYSMGSEELPSVIGAGVSGPSARK